MAKTNKKALRTRANGVKNEITPKANTAEKVGGLIADFIDSVAVEYDPEEGYDTGQWLIWNGRLLQVVSPVLAGQTPVLTPAKYLDSVVSSSDGITPDGPNLPVLSRALYQYLQTLQTGNSPLPNADEITFGKVRRANSESLLDPENSTDYASPAQIRALFDAIIVELNAKGGFNIPTLEKVINQGNEAKKQILARKGLTITAGKSELTEGDDEPALFLEDLPMAPEEGEFVPLVLETVYNRVYKTTFARQKSLQDGATQSPAIDLGDPVLPDYSDRSFQSGAPINFTLAPATKADGSTYTIPLLYVLEGLFDGIRFEPGTRVVNGKVITDTELFTTAVLKAIVQAGPRKGRSVEKSFKLTISPKPVVDLPKPVIGDIAAASFNQSAAISIQATVTHTKAGKWSATGLPSGASINEGSGLISGSAITAGTFLVTVTFTDIDGQAASKTFTLTITAVPVSNWLKSIAFDADVNTKAVNVKAATIAGIGTMQIAVEGIDGLTRTGKTRDGLQWSTLSTDAAFWQNCIAETSYSGQFNFSGFYYPQSFNPITGGLTFGKKYKVYIRRNSSDTPIVRYFYLNPSTNTNITPLLETEPADGGGGTVGNRPPSPPTFTADPIYVNEDFEQYIDGFTDPDGDILGAEQYTFGTLPTGVSILFLNNINKFKVYGKVPTAQSFSVSITANDGHGGITPFSTTLTASVRSSFISAIYRQYAIGGSLLVNATVSGSGTPEIKYTGANESLPLVQNGVWLPMLQNDTGRYGRSLNVSAGAAINIQIRMIGQQDAISLTFVVPTPFPANTPLPGDLLYPTTAGNPTTQLRVGNPDPLNPIFLPALQWVQGPDGQQWVQITDNSTRPATLGWRWTKNGRKVAGLPILVPANTKIVLEKTDAAGYDPQNDETRDKAQLVLETGNPGSPINTQNT